MSETLSNCHVWGCPTYVLEPKLQKPGVKVPSWDPRIRRGVNMGFSKIHSTQVGLDINLLTGSISPQFHVVFDDIFLLRTSKRNVHQHGSAIVTTVLMARSVAPF